MRLERRDLQLLGIAGRRADGIKRGSHHCPALQSENQGDVVQIVPGPYSDEGQTLVERITEKDGASFQFALKSKLGRVAVQSRAAKRFLGYAVQQSRADLGSGIVGSLRFAWAEGPRSRDRAKS